MLAPEHIQAAGGIHASRFEHFRPLSHDLHTSVSKLGMPLSIALNLLNLKSSLSSSNWQLLIPSSNAQPINQNSHSRSNDRQTPRNTQYRAQKVSK